MSFERTQYILCFGSIRAYHEDLDFAADVFDVCAAPQLRLFDGFAGKGLTGAAVAAATNNSESALAQQFSQLVVNGHIAHSKAQHVGGVDRAPGVGRYESVGPRGAQGVQERLLGVPLFIVAVVDQRPALTAGQNVAKHRAAAHRSIEIVIHALGLFDVSSPIPVMPNYQNVIFFTQLNDESNGWRVLGA